MHKKIIRKLIVTVVIICILLCVLCGSTDITYGYDGPKLGTGETAEIAKDLQNILYSAQLEKITSLKNSTQKEIRDYWTEQGSNTDAHNWAYIEHGGMKYYLIATGQYFGNVGDYLIVTLQNGDTYFCIMADAKGEETYEEALAKGYPNYAYYDSEGRHLGHWYYEAKKLDIMELVVGSTGEWTATAEGETLTLYDLGQVSSIINGGNYEEYSDGPVGADGITYTLTAGTESSKSSFVENFKKNAIGTILSLILDGLRTIADGIQMIIDCIQNSTLHIGIKLMYEYTELQDDVGPEENNDGAGNTDAYTNVSGYVSGGNSASDLKEGQIGVDVTESYYSSETEIPVITVDYYNFAVNDINFLDINYLTGDQDHDTGSPWMIIRNFAVAFIRMILYISAILLITMLIVHGVNVVQFSMTGLENPKKQLDSKKGMDKFITAVCMLIGTIVISSLCIFGTEALCEMIAVDSINSDGAESTSEYELPIRVHVSSAGYSFSTNFTGYARYMTQIDDVDEYVTKAMYTFVYIVFVILNVIGLGFMLFRLFALYVLAAYGPITVVMYMFSKETELGKVPTNYKNWASLYCLLCLTQLIFAISYRAVISWVAN